MDNERRKQLDHFFKQQETQAYKMTFAMTQNRDDALELVQDSMLKLVQKYSAKPKEEWKLLFYRILQNRIRDFHRRQGVSRLFNAFFPADNNSKEELINQTPDSEQNNPQRKFEHSSALKQIINALKTLPLRQQQTFLLRAWQEFNTRETAFALSISEGSVKTHYSRALTQLKKLLGDKP